MDNSNEKLIEKFKSVEKKISEIQKKQDYDSKELILKVSEIEILLRELIQIVAVGHNTLQKKIDKKLINLKYADVDDWRDIIWQRCEYKHEVATEDDVKYMCKKTKGVCNFADCPLNRL